MCIRNVTDGYNDTLSINNNCTNNDNNFEIVIPLITIVPCGMSLICLISLMVYTLVKPLLNKNKILSNINGEVSLSKSSCQVYYNRA